ncbi:MAG: hypothetical protein V5A43_05625 [Haloarculaceae archaeon]
MKRSTVALAVALVVASTLVIASAMMGGLAILTGAAEGVGYRVPFYVLGGAAVFTGLVIYLEMHVDDGLLIISVSLAVGLVAFVLITLGVEGLYFSVRKPDRMLSNLSVYLLAAGLISTGIIFWAVRHWREFTRSHEIV